MPDYRTKSIPAVEVEWLDSASREGWTSATTGEVIIDPIKCYTVGYLIHKDRSKVVLIQSLSDSNFVDQILVIPRGMIVSIETLKPARKHQ